MGNRALGDRLPPDAHRVALAVVLFATTTPLVFMGEEHDERAPFQFFTDHTDSVIADATRGVLVGASTMGPAAGEILGIFLLAIGAQVPVSDLRELIFPYPTFLRGIEPAIQQLTEAGPA